MRICIQVFFSFPKADCFVCFFFNSHVHWRYRYEQPLYSWFVAVLVERMWVGNLNRTSQLIWLYA